MSQLTIEIDATGDNLARITVTDREGEETLHLDMADVAREQESGTEDVIHLIVKNADSAMHDMIRAAYVNETPVTLDGQPVTREQLAYGLNIEAAPGV